MSKLLAPQGRLWLYALLLAILSVIQLAMPFLLVPKGAELAANILASVVFVATPILAIFAAAGYAWTSRLAILFLACGALAHVASVSVHAEGLLALFIPVVRQTGLISWCLGLGALLSTLIKDKNLIVPIAIFLALLDMVLVLTPIGLTQKLLTEHSKQAKQALYEVPRPKTTATPKGEAPKPVAALAYTGPADFLFLGMFFVALYRFKMRTRQTLIWIVPVLIAYLMVVLLAGNLSVFGVSLGMLPALLPIGVTVFLVNRKEFSLSRDEVLSTLLVAGLMIGVLAYGMTRPRHKVEPSPAPAGEAVAPAR